MAVAAAGSRRGLGAWKIPLAIGGLGYLALVFVTVVKAGGQLDASPTQSLVLALLPICAVLAVRHPLTIPFALYVALLPFDSLLVVSGATLPRFAAILLGGMLVIHAILKRRACVPAGAWKIWAIYIGYVLLTMLWAQDEGTSQQVGFAMLQLFILTTAMAIYPIEAWEFETAIALIVPCGVAAAGYALKLYLSGMVTHPGDASARVEVASASGVVIDYNAFAASFVIPISVALAIALFSKRLLLRLACTAATLIMFTGCLVTGSRGGFLACVAVLVYFGLRTRYRLQTLGVILGGAALSALVPSVWARFANDPSEAGSGSGRTFIWQTGLHAFQNHWLFGVGIGGFSLEYDRNFYDVFQRQFQGWSRPPHSVIVESLVETGVIGFLLVCSAWYGSFRSMKDVPQSSPRYRYRIAFEGALVSLFCMALTIDPSYVKYMWLANALPLLLLNVEKPRYFKPNIRAA